MGKKQAAFKAHITRERAATYLEELAASLRAGTVALSQGDRQVVLSPSSSMGLELEVSEKKDRQRLALELTWYVTPEVEGEDALTISAQPVATAEEADAKTGEGADAKPGVEGNPDAQTPSATDADTTAGP